MGRLALVHFRMSEIVEAVNAREDVKGEPGFYGCILDHVDIDPFNQRVFYCVKDLYVHVER